MITALSGIRSRVRTSENTSQEQLLDCLKSEFCGHNNAVPVEQDSPVGAPSAEDEESEVSDSELQRLRAEVLEHIQ